MDKFAYRDVLHEFFERYLLLTLVVFFFGGVGSWALHSWVNAEQVRECEGIQIENVQLRNRVAQLEILQGQLAFMAQSKAQESAGLRRTTEVLSLELETLKTKSMADINPYNLPKMIVLKKGVSQSLFKGRLVVEVHSLDPEKYIVLSVRDLAGVGNYLFFKQSFSAEQSKIFQLGGRAYELKVVHIDEQQATAIISTPVYY